jgi:hypothetical protein
MELLLVSLCTLAYTRTGRGQGISFMRMTEKSMSLPDNQSHISYIPLLNLQEEYRSMCFL